MKEDFVTRLKEFMENEARSCSMDFGCVTPLELKVERGDGYLFHE